MKKTFSSPLYSFYSFFLIYTAGTTLLLSSVSYAELPNAPVVLDSGSGGCAPRTEICGDGVDQDCNGSDLLCSGNDKDMDGFPANLDCNDANRFVYPGISTKCSTSSGTGVQKCNSNGSFSACSSAPVCEAVGSGKCYYVSKLTGKDSNPGTFAKPFKTYLQFVSYYSSGDKPSGHVDLKAGDVVYFMSGVYDENFVHQVYNRALYLRQINGTSSAPITLKAYPGTHPVLSSKSKESCLYIAQSSHILIEGFEITKCYGSGIHINGSSHVEVRNIWGHDNDGTDNHNPAAITVTSGRNVRLHHNILHDNYDRVALDTGGKRHENSRNVVLFKGSNNRVDHNIIFQSKPKSSDITGGCVTYKHSADLAGYETQTSEFDHNMLWNCFFTAIGSGSHRSRIHHNLIIDSDPIRIKDHGGTTHIRDNIVEYNTIVNTDAMSYRPTDTYSAIGALTFRNNIITENTGNTNWEATFEVHTYGSNAIYNKVIPTGLMRLSNNCYYNSVEAPRFNLFGNTSSGNLGGMYNFSQWKSVGLDTSGSIIANPQLNSEFIPGNPSCAGKGHRVGW